MRSASAGVIKKCYESVCVSLSGINIAIETKNYLKV